MDTDKKQHEPYPFFVDAVRYETDKSSLTGAEIKAQANVTATYQLFLEEEGDKPDRLIGDGDSVELKRGEHTRHFYAVPPATFGLE